MTCPKKKLFSLPLLFLTSLAVTLCITSISSVLGNSESIEVKLVRSLDKHIYPGQQTTLMLSIKNKAHETCQVFITETHKFPEGVYMSVSVSGLNYKFGEKIIAKPNQAISVKITVVASKGAGAGKITLTVMVKATSPKNQCKHFSFY